MFSFPFLNGGGQSFCLQAHPLLRINRLILKHLNIEFLKTQPVIFVYSCRWFMDIFKPQEASVLHFSTFLVCVAVHGAEASLGSKVR